MKVRELQEHLSKLDPELDVVCYSEEDVWNYELNNIKKRVRSNR